MVQLLIDRGANVNHADMDGCTPISEAAENGYKDTVELLIDRGADINRANIIGWTPLFVASMVSFFLFLKIFI